MDELLNLLDKVGGYDCHVKISNVLDSGITSLSYGFFTNISSVGYGYEDNEMQISHRNDGKLSNIAIDLTDCKLLVNMDTLSASFIYDAYSIRMVLGYDMNSLKLGYQNNIRLPQAKKGEYPCEVCGKLVGSTSGLTLHIKNSHPEEYEELKLTCKKCGKKCNSSSGYTLHVKNCDK